GLVLRTEVPGEPVGACTHLPEPVEQRRDIGTGRGGGHRVLHATGTDEPRRAPGVELRTVPTLPERGHTGDVLEEIPTSGRPTRTRSRSKAPDRTPARCPGLPQRRSVGAHIERRSPTMNPYADPTFVAAEVAYRFERDRITDPPVASTRGRRAARWLHRLTHRGSASGHRPDRTRRA